MSQLPVNFNVDLGAKYLKHVQKLDAAVFPDCHSVERTWRIRRGLAFESNKVYVHHYPECKWSILRIGIEKGKIVTERLI
jgi:hypothetical protein